MLAFLAVTMGLPLFFLLMGSFNLVPPGKEAVYGLDNWVRAFSDPGTLSALWMSFLLSMVRLIPAMIFSVLFAWLIARTDMPGGKTVESFCWIAYFVPDFPLHSRVDSFVGSQFRISQHVGKESSPCRRPAVQSLQFLGHRLGAHVDRRHMVQGYAAGAGLSPARSLVGRSGARVRRQHCSNAPPHHIAGALAHDPGGFSSQLHPRTTVFQHGVTAGDARQNLCLLDSNLRLFAARTSSLW